MQWVSYAVTAAALFVVGGVGARATDIGPWYRNLNKPSWNPPDWAFPVVWTTIYILIIASVGRGTGTLTSPAGIHLTGRFRLYGPPSIF